MTPEEFRKLCSEIEHLAGLSDEEWDANDAYHWAWLQNVKDRAKAIACSSMQGVTWKEWEAIKERIDRARARAEGEEWKLGKETTE